MVNNMKLIPKADSIVVKTVEDADVSSSTIVVPTQYHTCEIIGVGDDLLDEYNIGDKILVSKVWQDVFDKAINGQLVISTELVYCFVE